MPGHLLPKRPDRKKTLNRELNIRLHFFITSLLAFLLPIYPDIIPAVIVLLIINWAAGGNFTLLFQKNSSLFLFLLSISLYLLYATGLIYSKNLDYGLKDLETKLSLLVFPLLFYSSEKMNKQNIQFIFRAFLYGCLTAAIICIGYAFYQYAKTQYLISQGIKEWDYGINFFLKNRLSLWMHPGYRSMYFVMALAANYMLREKEKHQSGWEKYFIPFTLSISILLFNSKAGIISLLLLGIYIGWQLIFKERRKKLAIAGTAVSLLLFFSLYFASPEFGLRIKSLFTAFAENTDTKKSEESTATRIALWNATKAVISKNLLIGTGTGDVKDALMNEYRKEGMTFALQENLNSHNQFLQTFATLGCVGFFFLCASLLIPLLVEIKKRKYLFIAFVLIIIINLLTESMFETQSGVVFYAFFNSLLLFSEEEEI